ncbi:hypothetical protein OSB04_008659 [Centaurea solstitialis]|uniref:Enoyl reductase (ER) domain-containing protein n=1 Tax=Centaurea solstitialis TaxID=347529 RepID=A0AA38TNY5_9ASTR|nr:hypothetical protein OSB04_008659 [Centaurea solstitialis]
MGSLPETEHPVKALGYAARDPSGQLSPINFSRRETGDEDVRFKVLYCGVCHSDLHSVKNEWFNAKYPMIPGHEIVGVVTEVGSKVKKVKVGDKVGVGCMVGSCRSCDQCGADQEQYCPKMVQTYNDATKTTYGGYSDHMVCDQHFIITWPENLPLDGGAPLLCAGITVYSPMRYYGLDKPGMHVGVVGLGGLGHVAVKFLKALGLKVTVISTSPNKKEEAINNLGADSFLISRDQAQMQGAVGTMDGVIDTVSADHPLVPLIGLLKPNGNSPETEHPVKALGYAARDSSGVLSSFKFSRRETGDEDVRFKVLYCGVCHSDLHFIKNEWSNAKYPMGAVGTMDGVIDTVSADHPLVPLIGLLKPNGKLVLVGAPTKPHELPAFPLLFGRKLVGGSLIGGIKETQEMIDFAAKHKITAAIELIPMDYINTAMDRLVKADVRYRFVIDIANTLK